ncbi:MAG TPA: hypothetical protein VK962_07955 [Actinomycetota bacterium]|nr:hypothetical protein [Actinomycetota bacterium]
MRDVLEVLGILRHDARRRDPVALPAWVRLVAPLAVAFLTAVSFALFWLIREALI